jgi:hypothetical protein
MLGRAGALMGLLAVIAVSCSSDIVELLPLTGGTSTGGAGSSAGQDTVTSGAGTGGSNAAGMTTQAGFAGAPQAGGGNGGNGGSAGGCFGFGCGGESGFGGSFGGPYCRNGNSCQPCTDSTDCPTEYEHCGNNVCVQCVTEGPSQCRHGFNCDVVAGRCGIACDDNFDCKEGGVCDLNQNTCVWCLENRDCTQDGVPAGDVCYLHRCVDCTQDPDCIKQGRGRRCSGFRCVECLSNTDCDDGRGRCNVPKGYCE